MTKTAAVEQAKVEQKAPEKRRALGRGLESLLPGPRAVVVAPARAEQEKQVPPLASQRSDSVGMTVTNGDEQQVPHRDSTPVRNDNAAGDVQTETLGTTSPLLAKEARNGAPQPSESSASPEVISISAEAETRIPTNLVVNIPIEAIDKNPYQTRLIFEEEPLEELAESIKRSGVVQPIVVRPSEDEDRFVLVLGERRLRASKMAGKETIPAIVRRVSMLQAAELTLIENLQREDLNCMEQAEAFRVLSKDFNLTQSDIAARVGVSRESVSNYMRLHKLPKGVQEYLIAGGLDFSQAKVLLQLENVEQLERLADMAVEKCMNVEQLRDAVMRLDGWLDAKPGLDPNEKPKPKGGARWVDPNVRAAQVELQSLLRMRVRISDRKGKGRIVIEYATVDDYERVVGMLRGK